MVEVPQHGQEWSVRPEQVFSHINPCNHGCLDNLGKNVYHLGQMARFVSLSLSVSSVWHHLKEMETTPRPRSILAIQTHGQPPVDWVQRLEVPRAGSNEPFPSPMRGIQFQFYPTVAQE